MVDNRFEIIKSILIALCFLLIHNANSYNATAMHIGHFHWMMISNDLKLINSRMCLANNWFLNPSWFLTQLSSLYPTLLTLVTESNLWKLFLQCFFPQGFPNYRYSFVAITVIKTIECRFLYIEVFTYNFLQSDKVETFYYFSPCQSNPNMPNFEKQSLLCAHLIWLHGHLTA